jgi:hypothetical protein
MRGRGFGKYVVSGAWRRWRAWSGWRRALVVFAVVLVAVAAPVLAAGTALLLADAGQPDQDARTRGRDGFWLGHAWVDGRKTEAGGVRIALALQSASL